MNSNTDTVDITGVSALRRLADFFELTKPRIVLMVLVTAFVGFYVGSEKIPDYLRLLQMLLGTALAAGGTLALNQFLERDTDAMMERTRHRPLPDGRVQPREAVWFGTAITIAGLAYLALAVNIASAWVTAIDYVELSVLLYTVEAPELSLHARWRRARGSTARHRLGRRSGASSKSMRGYFSRSCSCGRCRTLWLSPGFTETILPRRESSFFRSSSPMGRAPIARSSAIAPPCWRSVCCRLCSGLPGPSIFWSHLCWALGFWRAGSVSPWSQRWGARAGCCLPR